MLSGDTGALETAIKSLQDEFLGAAMFRHQDQEAEKFTLAEALKDFGWLPLLLSGVVSAPSILALLEMIFIDHRLSAAFQWIVDGYVRIVTVVGAAVEPQLQPIIDRINTVFHWDIVLRPHWRPLFLLSMMFVAGIARASWQTGAWGIGTLLFISLTLGASIGSLTSGLMPLSGSWAMQGVAAALPAAMITVFFVIPAIAKAYLPGLTGPTVAFLHWVAVAAPGRWMWVAQRVSIAAIAPPLLAFALAAAFALVPGLSRGAGILALGTLIGTVGVVFLVDGVRDLNRLHSRLGLTILGGFAAAGLVLIADVVVKVLS